MDAKVAVLIEVSFTYNKHTDLKSCFLFQDGQMRQSGEGMNGLKRKCEEVALQGEKRPQDGAHPPRHPERTGATKCGTECKCQPQRAGRSSSLVGGGGGPPDLCLDKQERKGGANPRHPRTAICPIAPGNLPEAPKSGVRVALGENLSSSCSSGLYSTCVGMGQGSNLGPTALTTGFKPDSPRPP